MRRRRSSPRRAFPRPKTVTRGPRRAAPSVHPWAEGGFGRAAEAYERGRPGYPAAAVDFLAARFGLAPGGVVVDLGARRVTRAGVEVILSPTEYALLSELAGRAGHVTDHATLLAAVWGPDHIGERNYLRTFVQRLRLKLEDHPSEPQVIVTVGRQGYRFGDAPA